MMAASMAASICPAVPALAVTKNQVAADGPYTKTAHVTKTEEDVDDNWNEYDVEVTLSVEDGKLKDISVSPKTDMILEMIHISTRLITSRKELKQN